MQIIIPMSGFGERFRRAGYTVPKPLIEVDGKPIIGHVIDLFPGETNFIFICNEDHLANPDYRLEKILRALCPSGRIIGIPAHKLGPIFAVRQAEHLLDLSRPVVVNYCDFTCYWNWRDFKAFVAQTACDGAIPAYKGFHPHTLGATNYAYLKEADGWVSDIQEKQPYTDNRMEEYASSGTYYFASAKIMSASFKQTMEQNLSVDGEFYVSLAYKPLLSVGARIAVYPLQHFMQWGTPDDLAEYGTWSQTFRQLLDDSNPKNLASASAIGSVVIPMAGLGKRFSDEGYEVTKPLIAVSGKAMAIQAIDDLPKSRYQSLVLRSDMPGISSIETALRSHYPNAILSCVPGVTDGQACTALIGLDKLNEFHPSQAGSDLSPVTFGACDNGVIFDRASFQALIDNPAIDVIIWGARGHTNAIRNPNMFGWIDADAGGIIQNISVKTPLESPATDPVVIGTFTFKRSVDAKRAINSLIARNGRINNEFYLDSCINDALALGMRCHLFEVDSFISWGTPNDLKTFQYWQSCFHKWEHHPYRLELDPHISPSAAALLCAEYAEFKPALARKDAAF